jgi:hypothetical protein
MASQVVALPTFLLDAIIDSPSIQHHFAFGARGMDTKIGTLADGTRVLRVEIDRHLLSCPRLPHGLCDGLYAVLLTSDPTASGLVLPRPLPAPMATLVLDLTLEALLEFRRLTGHDKLQVASCIDQARQEPPSACSASVRTPVDAGETTRLAQASDLQAVLRPALNRMDRRLAGYAREVRRNRLEMAMIRLGLQADLGASLRLDPFGETLVPRLATPHRRGEFRKLWQATQNALSALQSCSDAIHADTSDGGNWLQNALLPMHSTLLYRLVPPDWHGRHRSARMQIRSPIDGTIHVPTLPAEDVPQATDAWARGFDARLWRDVNPLLRGGMAHVELMALHPFGDGNGRLGRLLLQMMLVENEVPGLPLEAVFKWNRHLYLERVDAAVRKADLLGFMQFLLKAIDKAIDLGRHFMREFKPCREELRTSFADGGARFAGIASELAGSMMLGPDLQLAQRMMVDPDDLFRHLDSAGFDVVSTGRYDLAGYEAQEAWSSPVARDLLIAPPARM